MDAEAVWRSKSDEQLLAAGASLSDFTEEGERVIRAELARRGLPDPPAPIGACARCGRSVYATTPQECPQCNTPLGEALRQAQLAVERPREPPNPELSGIGGWLVLPAIQLVVGAGVGSYSVAEAARVFPELARLGLGGLFVFIIAVESALVIFTLVAAAYFFLRSPRAPRLMIALYVAIAGAYGIVAAVAAAAGVPDVAREGGFSCFRATLIACIWVPYFKISKRVKATFVN